MKAKCPKCGGSDITMQYKERTEYIMDGVLDGVIILGVAIDTHDCDLIHIHCHDCDAYWESEKDFTNELS